MTVSSANGSARSMSGISGTSGVIVEEIKFLSVTINERLNWKSHVNITCPNASRRLYALRLLKPIMPTKELIVVYYGTLRSVLEYASPSFVKLPNNLSDELEKIQRRAHHISGTSQCTCGYFEQLSVRRLFAAKKLYTASAHTNTHIQHDIIPPLSNRSHRYILPHASTSRFLHSFTPYVSASLNQIT